MTVDIGRVCTKCGETKPEAEFPRHTGTRKRKECKRCYAAYMRGYLASHPKQRADAKKRAKARNLRLPEERKATKLRLKFGQTLSEYDAMLANQGGVCAICKCMDRGVDYRTEKPLALAVDHNHDTGVVRGLLCANCNRALGLVKESPTVLREMISYLSCRAVPNAKTG